MDNSELFEVSADLLPHVIESLSYTSENALKQDVEILKDWMKAQKHLPEIMVAETSAFIMNSVECMEVNDDVLSYVISSLNYKSEKALKNDIEIVKEWMKTQKHLPEVMDDKKIQNFLILNKGSIERTKGKIDMYYTIRSQLTDIFDGINPNLPYMQHTLDTFYLVPLLKLTEDKFRVFFSKIKNKELAENFDHINGIRYMVNLLEVRLSEDVPWGDVIILDGKDAPLNLILNATPSIVYKGLLAYTNVFSSRLKAVYVINAPPFAEILLKILKTLMKPKLLDRIHFCTSENFLIEHFGKEMIPKEYGGEEKSLEELQKMVRNKLVQYAERFDALDVLRVKEDLRPKNLENDEMLGYHGSFKRLEID